MRERWNFMLIWSLVNGLNKNRQKGTWFLSRALSYILTDFCMAMDDSKQLSMAWVPTFNLIFLKNSTFDINYVKFVGRRSALILIFIYYLIKIYPTMPISKYISTWKRKCISVAAELRKRVTLTNGAQLHIKIVILWFFENVLRCGAHRPLKVKMIVSCYRLEWLLKSYISYIQSIALDETISLSGLWAAHLKTFSRNQRITILIYSWAPLVINVTLT